MDIYSKNWNLDVDVLLQVFYLNRDTSNNLNTKKEQLPQSIHLQLFNSE